MIDKDRIVEELRRLYKAHQYYLLYENNVLKVTEIFEKAQAVIDKINAFYPDEDLQMFCEWLIIGGGEFLGSLKKPEEQLDLTNMF